MNRIHVAAYIRTSTKDQDGKGQRESIRRALEARGWDATFFLDQGVSGARASRPELDVMVKGAKAGKYCTVVIAGLDRLGRSLVDLLHLLQGLSNAGCSVVSLREGVDFSTAAGRLQIQLLGAFAEFEREILVERVNAGIRAARIHGTRSGNAIGRPRLEVRAEQVLGMRLDDGLSWSEIARALGVSRSTARRIYAYAKTPPGI
ncbi:MAG: recombinase family protein [Planctomycetes bacterium]|nr:recombinase family protein [Planctomycetota bacterium]